MTTASPLLPSINLHPLTTSDGSALYTTPNNTISVLCSVSYPLEIPQRSSELPTTTLIDVNLRPHNAVGGVKERHVESIVKRVLESVVLGEETPRCMLQVGLQIVHMTEDENLPGGVKAGGQGESYLEVLCAAVNAAVAGCLDGSVKMRGILGCILVGMDWEDRIRVWPDLRGEGGRNLKSLHVLAVGKEEEILLMESQGRFDVDMFERVQGLAKKMVAGQDITIQDHEDVNVDEHDNTSNLLATFRTSVEKRFAQSVK